MDSLIWCVEIKFIYSEKATRFCEIFAVDLSFVVSVKSTVEIAQNFVAFSENINFTSKCELFLAAGNHFEGLVNSLKLIMYPDL